MKHRLDSGFKKFQNDRSLGRIQIILYDEEEIQILVPGSKDEEYLVSCSEGFWRCECFDWNRWWKSTDKVGSFCCKHIEEAHYEIAKLKGIFSQSSLGIVVDNRIEERKVVIRKDGISTYELGENVIILGKEYKIVKIVVNGKKVESELVLVEKEEYDRRKLEK